VPETKNDSQILKNMNLVAALLVVAFCTALGALVFNNTLTLRSIESKLDSQVDVIALKDEVRDAQHAVYDRRWMSVWPRLRELERAVNIHNEDND